MNAQTRAESKPCYFAALDHRNSFARSLSGVGADHIRARRAEPRPRPHVGLGAEMDCGPARRADLKQTIWKGIAGILARVPEHAQTAILIDRGCGQIAVEAEAAGVAVAVALEASGRGALHAEAPLPVLREDLHSFRPSFGKVLVRWHPDALAPDTRGQLRTLRELDELVRAAGADLLVELLITREPHSGAGGTQSRHGRPRTQQQRDRQQAELPLLQRSAVEEILAAGVTPALWKIEGHPDAEAAGALAELLGSARPDASILVLGGGSEISGLRRLFLCRAGSERFSGFAVGRSIWQRPLSALWRGDITQAEARRAIGERFLAVIDAFESAAQASTPQC